MITVYLDMDGVLCNFDKRFAELYGSSKFDKKNFREAIMEHKLFETLEPMWEANTFSGIIDMYTSRGVHFQVLSSLGNPKDQSQRDESVRQKNMWLLNNGFNIPAVYVQHKGLKKHFSSANSVLLDDTQQNVWDWEERSGKAFHYDPTPKSHGLFSESMQAFETYIMNTSLRASKVFVYG